MKKVLLLVIDALASDVLEPAIAAGRLPHFAQLAAAGRISYQCTVIFPSITPAATSSLATGCYPGEHGISGAHYFDREADQVHYFGSDIWIAAKEGIGHFFQDFLIDMNERWLRAPTVFEHVQQAGLHAGCLNFLIFRGQTPQRVHAPWLLRLWPTVPFSAEVHGPQTLCLGDFVRVVEGDPESDLPGAGGLSHRYGFDDENTAQALLALAQRGELPDFTLAYFPDNDYRSHAVGRCEAEPVLESIDRHLGELAAIYGGVPQMLEQLTILVTGDHSQSEVEHGANRGGVDLAEVLSEYPLVPPGANWEGDEQLMICANLRAAQIYIRSGCWRSRQKIIATLLAESRVDQVIWQGDAGDRDRFRYHVATADRGQLTFWNGDDGAQSARDAYGAVWSWQGRLEAVDAGVDDAGQLEYGDYPNAFERIVGAFNPRVSGDLWVTARLGFELRLPQTSLNECGSHGTLHRLDSTVPLLVAGAPADFALPAHPRSIDVMPICLTLLGLTPPRAIGASIVGRSE